VVSRKKKRRAAKLRAVQEPRRREPALHARRRWIWVAVGLAVGAVATTIAVTLGGAKEPAVAPPDKGLPHTPDYHSLSVNPANPSRVLLGTHVGLYRSLDGGQSWQFEGLSGQDAMSLARPSSQTLWTAGHYVLAKSTDGGRSWVSVRPSGLPTLDVHGFAIDPRNPRIAYAAIAGRGLYRSTDNGATFNLVSNEVGGAVMALAVTPSGDLLAGDMQRGLLTSRDGKTWRLLLRARVIGLAINPRDPKRILAAGPGIILSTDGGRHWRQALKIDEGAGPVAWSPSRPKIAYVVGFDRMLYRSTDAGETWSAVQ
jgi:photosystem II stability/assembly factor-like uncharacterized protein